MRYLDKPLQLATAFKAWQEANPKVRYNSSDNEYYVDVVSELLMNQFGLCAYTEIRLAEASALETLRNGFQNGKQTAPFRTYHSITLDHFDPTLKKSEPWDWTNLFVVFGPVNEEKGSKSVKLNWKPNHEGYDPFDLLDYDERTHLFRPSDERIKSGSASEVWEMIDTLGLNHPLIQIQRSRILGYALKLQRKFMMLQESPDQFPTAFAMIQRNPRH